MEKKAHSSPRRAQMNQITQAAIEFSISRGTTTLTIIMAESHDNVDTHKPYPYMAKDLNVVFDQDKQGPGQRNLGFRIKERRLKRAFSQAKLAKTHQESSDTNAVQFPFPKSAINSTVICKFLQMLCLMEQAITLNKTATA